MADEDEIEKCYYYRNTDGYYVYPICKKDAAILLIKQVGRIIFESESWTDSATNAVQEAFNMAIKALEEYIDPQDLLKAVYSDSRMGEYEESVITEIVEELKGVGEIAGVIEMADGMKEALKA
jgi:hypothetical protein